MDTIAGLRWDLGNSQPEAAPSQQSMVSLSWGLCCLQHIFSHLYLLISSFCSVSIPILCCTQLQLAKAHPDLLEDNCTSRILSLCSVVDSLAPDSQPKPHRSKVTGQHGMVHLCVWCSLPSKQPPYVLSKGLPPPT